MNARAKIVVVRLDKLGDVLLALPTVAYLRQVLPDAKIDLLCQGALHPLLENFLCTQKVGVLSPTSGTPWRDYDAALCLFAPTAVQWQIWKAGVKHRWGVRSRWSSFLLYNRGVAQHRSRAKKNEAEYNLDLAVHLVENLTGKKHAVSLPPLELPVHTAGQAEARAVSQAFGPYFVCHPGMGGSALNLSAEKYLSLFDFLGPRLGATGIFSQGPGEQDAALARRLLALRPGLKFVQGLSLPALGEFFREARLVVAPSTGPLHLAHLVGTETVGVYSPVPSQHPRRWQPWGGRARVQVLVPDLLCPASRACLGATCPKYFCLDGLEWSGLRFEGARV